MADNITAFGIGSSAAKFGIDDALVITFPNSEKMSEGGYKMTESSIDESGHFIVITWEKEKEKDE